MGESTHISLTSGAAGPQAPRHDEAVRPLVLRAVRAATRLDRGASDLFLLRRAVTDARSLSRPREQSCVLRLLELALEPAPAVRPVTDGLVEWAGLLESRGRLDAAAEVLELATDLRPGQPELVLHRARTERKRGHTRDARALYDRVAELAGDARGLSLMATVGRALTGGSTEEALSRVLRRAVREGVHEAAAVAQEERARARRARGDVQGALRDYLAAGARYDDPIDRGRVGLELADLLGRVGDLEGARAALQETERRGHPEQVDLARARLETLARSQGDELGMRRYASTHAPTLVSLAPGARRTSVGDAGHRSSAGDVIRRGLARLAGAPSGG